MATSWQREGLRKKYGLYENLKVLLDPDSPKNKIVGYLNEANLIKETYSPVE